MLRGKELLKNCGFSREILSSGSERYMKNEKPKTFENSKSKPEDSIKRLG